MGPTMKDLGLFLGCFDIARHLKDLQTLICFFAKDDVLDRSVLFEMDQRLSSIALLFIQFRQERMSPNQTGLIAHSSRNGHTLMKVVQSPIQLPHLAIRLANVQQDHRLVHLGIHFSGRRKRLFEEVDSQLQVA